MPNEINNYRFQKCSDVERELPIFEVIDKEGVPIMDFAMNAQTNEVEIFFHRDIERRVLSVKTLLQLIDDGVKLLEREW